MCKPSIGLLIILALAFAIRFAAVLTLRDVREGPGSEFGADGIEFDQLGFRLAHGEGYTWPDGSPTAFRSPGLPLVLAIAHRLPGGTYPLVYLGLCGLGTLSCLASYQISRQLSGQGEALLAAALAAFYAPSIYLTTVFASENLFAPVIGFAVSLILANLVQPRAGREVGVGVLLGFAALTRPVGVLLIPVAGLAAAWAHRGNGRRLLAILRVVLASSLVLAPWCIRNARIWGRPVLATNGGSTFYGGNNDRVAREWPHLGGWLPTTELPGRDLVDATHDELSHDRVEWQLGWNWVNHHRALLIRLVGYKALRFWMPDLASANLGYRVLNLVGYTPYLILLLIAAWRLCRARPANPRGWLIVHACLALAFLNALVFWGSPRFRDANMPFLMSYAAVGLATCLRLKGPASTIGRGPSSSGDGPR